MIFFLALFDHLSITQCNRNVFLIGRGEDDLRLGCKAHTFFLNYMCHLISFVGLVLAIVRGVAPVSTIELARKEKKVLVCMCRFRSSSVVL